MENIKKDVKVITEMKDNLYVLRTEQTVQQSSPKNLLKVTFL